ncbi:hypothetical protein GOP47_0025917 [Adiantum capillus-veneris]|uniref:Uncharacterized protein n=1 Tax=Adiantum capillus-veneris TaxID=13818 RepID=A0A9D4U236_ADICA|nr:hypothetical protein GOP47_0025917 [Adiantum capillus-veneris]
MASKAKVSEENIQAMRAILGSDVPDMDLIRCLHLARNDVSLAISILFDTPHFRSMSTKKGQVIPAESSTQNQLQALSENTYVSEDTEMQRLCENNDDRICASSLVECVKASDKAIDLDNSFQVRALSASESSNDLDFPTMHEVSMTFVSQDNTTEDPVTSAEVDWWFLGEVDVVGFSTCKGVKLNEGEPVSFTFPRSSNNSMKPSIRSWGRGRAANLNPEIVRFSTREAGEIGRLPGDWARCLVPLVLEKKVKLEGYCKETPNIISLVDNITLKMKIHAHCSLFKKPHSHTSPLSTSAADKTVHPVPTLFHLLGLKPFKKAEFTPDDLFSKKRALDFEGAGISSFSAEQRLLLVSGPTQQSEEQGEEFLSDGEVDRLVGTTDARQLSEMEPPATLACSLRPYQKQALHWMYKLESGIAVEEASRTLHPCWDAFHLPDRRIDAVYINTFSGDATVFFPSALQMARGGILADAMGLGKTVMTISLLLSNCGKGGGHHQTNSSIVDSEMNRGVPSEVRKPDSFFATAQMRAKLRKSIRKGGGTLIVCPMTLLGQWKSELEVHSKPGTLTIYTHYGSARTRDSRALVDFEVVLTTYGVLGSEFMNNEGDGALHGIHWYRVVLDEAHTIKASKGQSAQAAFNLTADHRWCLTGTPIQNKLEDVFSLLHFLRVEPWSNWGWWNKLVQKPFQDGDERGLRILQAILKPLMLRRTKESTDQEGRPILELPPSEASVVNCEFSEAERDFYDALYKKSKVKFDKFVEQGRVLHNYASILELLLRLRQCCDHPFLVLSRGDTEEYADMEKLAKRLIGGHKATESKSTGAPTKAFIREVIEDIQKNDKAECPICLEAVEDAVLTPCAHCMCRECLYASWNGGSSGACPICRQMMNRQDIITVPTESRFQLDVEKNWKESSKVTALMQELEALQSSKVKSVVFSQWTAFLDLLEIPLKRKNIKFLRLDGTLSQQQREIVLHNFKSDSTIEVLLLSLKAGGVGINLTAAENAFLMDPWWNPAVEEQAIMRIHRIGQTKTVKIKRFITKGTVEQRMQQVQARKQRMIAGALTDQEVRTARIEELKMLFA